MGDEYNADVILTANWSQGSHSHLRDRADRESRRREKKAPSANMMLHRSVLPCNAAQRRSAPKASSRSTRSVVCKAMWQGDNDEKLKPK